MTDCNLHIWWVGLSSSVIPEKFKSTPTPLFEQPLNFIIHGVLLGDYGIPVVSCIVLNKQCPSITLLLLWQIHYYYVSPPFQVMYSPISSRKWIKENVCDIHKCIHVYSDCLNIQQFGYSWVQLASHVCITWKMFILRHKYQYLPSRTPL